MHSIRMRTGRSLTVCCRLPPGGEGGAWSGGVSWGVGVSAPGGSGPGGIPACTEADTLPPPVDRITDACKNLPWPNIVAAGKNIENVA